MEISATGARNEASSGPRRDDLLHLLGEVMVRDEGRLRALAASAGARSEAVKAVEGEILKSANRRRLRRERAVRLATEAFTPDLPIIRHRDEILRALERWQVIVVCGETGSGKTTQLPKICLSAGRGSGGMIGHTQPRRVAARTVAARIAEELGVVLGSGVSARGRADVGYRVRFEGRASLDQDADTLVKVMTDGVLLAEAAGGDRLLEQYDTIIIDEAHERSLNIDFLLGYLKRLLPRRADLRVIVTSATIDPARFSRHFGDAPIIEVSGRSFPVEMRYRPIDSSEIADAAGPDGTGDEDDEPYQRAIVRAVREALSQPAASALAPDVLVFLSGEREIRTTATTLRKHLRSPIEILPLFARLSTVEQDKVFQRAARSGLRRVVLATNVAETSLTVPGIGFVVDPGLARIGRYSPKHKIQRLPVEHVSRASADQRAGRCGRLSPGVCIRLYDREDYERRPRFTDPEILRTNLASVILQMKHLGLGEVAEFPFLDPPESRRVRDGVETLAELGAIDAQERLSPVGRELARLPIDPRLGRIILAAIDEECLDETLVIAAALSVQDPRQRPPDAPEEADRALAEFRSTDSDFVGLLRLWSAYISQSRGTKGAMRSWCRAHMLSPTRMREWHDVHRQLVRLTDSILAARRRHRGDREVEAPRMPSGALDVRHHFARLHRALLTGLIANIGMLGEAKEYTGPRGLKFSVHPGSGLFRTTHKWVVASELVRTTRTFARQAARIQPQWIERAAPHLVKRTYAEPQWDDRTARVLALEHVTLWGLDLIEGRKVHFGPIDPAAARQVFIQQGLVEGRYWTKAAFAKHNRSLLAQVESVRARLRRSDLAADAESQYAFYDRHIPPAVNTGQAFEGWLRHESRRNPRVLCMSLGDLMGDRAIDWPAPGMTSDESDGPRRSLDATKSGENGSKLALTVFPDEIDVAGMMLPLRYRFAPGEADDGATAIVPLAALARLHGPAGNRLEWLVPGLIEEKVIALLRSLPKDLRRRLGPAAEAARRCLAHMQFGQGDLIAELRSRIGVLAGAEIPEGALDLSRIPEHLRLNLRIIPDDAVDTRAKAASRQRYASLADSARLPMSVLAEARDLRSIRLRLGPLAGRILKQTAGSPWVREGVTSWDFDDLPRSVALTETSPRGSGVEAFPGIVDPGTSDRRSVNLRLFGTEADASAATRWGLRRLVVLKSRSELRSLVHHLAAPNGLDALRLLFALTGPADALEDDLMDLVAERAYFAGPGSGTRSTEVRSRGQFDVFVDAGWHRLAESASEAGDLAHSILVGHQRVRDRLDRVRIPNARPVVDDIREQLQDLLPQHRPRAPGGFLATTPWDRLIHLPRYLKAIDRRLEKLVTGGLERDAQLSEQVRPFRDAFLARRAKAVLPQHEDSLVSLGIPVLDEFAWLVEEFRVSLFAQELGTTEPVSAQRLQRRLADLTRD